MRHLTLLLALALLLLDSSARAVSIAFDPAAPVVPDGSPVTVDLVISGLGDSVAPSLGAFELDVLYDPTVLAFTTLSFGTELDLFGLGSTSGFDGSLAGTVSLFELSLDLPEDLDLLQAGSFTLATLHFDALAPGTTALDVASLLLGDSLGDPLTPDSVTSGSVTVVPEPATAALVASGLLMVSLARRRRAPPPRFPPLP